MLRTGWDIDGVGFNFGDSVHRWLCHTGLGHLWKSGPNPEPYWDFFKDWTKDDGTAWTGKDFVEMCNAGADAGFIFSGPVKEGYREAIEAVSRMGHEIIVATDRPFGSSPEVSEKLTVEWFQEHEINYDELHFTNKKSTANCDVFIDDKLENYDELVAAGTTAFLLNRPWNKVEGGDARNRVDSLEEYVEAISQITNQHYRDLTFA